MKLKGKESKLRKSLRHQEWEQELWGRQHCCPHAYLAAFQPAAHRQQGHILGLLFAETTTSETKHSLCCSEAGASKVGL